MTKAPLLIVILAAGRGVRMRSHLPKVLHPVGGRPMLGHVLATAKAAGASKVALVVAPGQDAVRALAEKEMPGIALFEQKTQAGTADAVLAAADAIAAHKGDVAVLFADTPLVRAETLMALVGVLEAGAGVAVLGFEPADPTGYGRVLRDAGGNVTAIREQKDASEAERAAKLCNAGAMAFRMPDLVGLLKRIENRNAAGEYYLTDAVALVRAEGRAVGVHVGSVEDAMGVNSRAQQAEAEAAFQQRMRAKAMAEGATLIAPETVWFSFDTKLGQDVIIEPNVFFGPGVVVEDGVTILANSHIVGARIGRGSRIGPFARLRPGADLAEDVHVGNFVEVKAATLEKGAKANHLAYIGDGFVGENANIGAGTIFCNYDGFDKHRTHVGKGAFVGSNSSLVAPVKIGDGAFVGSGSVITQNVEADALAVERAPLDVRPQWAAKFRQMKARRKAKR
ncbi:MAG: bifunctional UDP-N-acetylglucosamine diphosphorylase/glucosamine-1-phosphate N-acetyltransferase GlmU [Hyphomicrobiales bacterium]|nr:MAG: bifunctional UDP-N-acetylglucosamine diphosphorylase/glucosamine-1-phosphate N-acetyltransferase GlmU [Hyphomicrobiales bacterium]